jgi:hypothetical protein
MVVFTLYIRTYGSLPSHEDAGSTAHQPIRDARRSCGSGRRLQQTATGLEGRLNRRDTLIELIRSVNGTLDPSEVGDALLGQAAEWFPADCLVVAIQDGSPEPLVIAQRGPCDQYEDALAGVARWIAEHGQYDCLMVVADLKVGTTKLVADLNLGATKTLGT